MKNKSCLVLTALGLVLGSHLEPSFFVNKAPVEVEAVPHAANFDPYTYSGTYYDSITANGEGLNGTLRVALSNYITPKAYPTYSGTGNSNCLAFLLQEADADPTNSSNMIYLYTRDSDTKNAAVNWNREHVWPQSLSNDNWGQSKCGTDLLHLRPTYPNVNSSRGNCAYAELDNNTATYKTYNGMHYGYMSGGLFEPLEATKGDVARIIMYIWVAYQNVYSNMPAITQVFQSFDTLLNWHTDDKPDVLEGNRNDFSQTSLQKNRNPFVDRPEYAWKIFGNSASPSVKQRCMEAYPDGMPPVTLNSIQVTTPPTKTKYYVGETLDTTGMVVTAYYSNGTSQNVTSSCSFSPTTLNSVGNQVITVSYQGKTTTFSVTVITLNSIEVTTPPNKTNYYVGETLDTTGIVVTGHYSDGSTQNVTASCSFSPMTLNKAGNQAITVSYQGKTTTFIVSVATLNSIQVTTPPNKTAYFVGDTLDTTGIVVTAHYSDSTTQNVTASCSYSPTVLNTAGNQVITVSYKGKTTTFTVTVTDPVVVPITGVSLADESAILAIGETLTLAPTYAPSNAYPVPVITFASDNASVASVHSSSGLVTAVARGVATITVTATQNTIVKTTTIQIIVKDQGLDKIADVYDKALNSAVKVYGIYTGSYSNQYTGIFIGDGNYSIMIYGYTSSVSSLVPYESYVLVTGKLAMFNNLYQIAHDATIAPLSITAIDSEVGSTVVDPVTTYQYVGNEPTPGSSGENPKIQSRLTMVAGTVISKNGTIGTDDTTVVLSLPSGYTINIFIKKSAGLDYVALEEALGTTGNYARIKGFLGVYKTSYQIVLPAVIANDPSYTATSFANDFLNATATICSNHGAINNRTALLNIWIDLEENFVVLTTIEQTTLKNANPNSSGTAIEQAMARYDYVVGKYALTDFIDRQPAPFGSAYLQLQTADYIFIGFFISSLAVIALVSTIAANRKKKLAK